MIHREGRNTLLFVFLFLAVFNSVLFGLLIESTLVFYLSLAASLAVFVIILQFFRNPKRIPLRGEDLVISPADGKVVVIEKVKETEYFNDERIQISVFMSVWNVHKNWFPVSGMVKYFKYHNGKYLLAVNPKSSEVNERTTVVIENAQKKQILFRQIAGIVARRIVYYINEGMNIKQSDECGFIKFGSRLDILLPLDAQINVKIGDKVIGSRSVIAYI